MAKPHIKKCKGTLWYECALSDRGRIGYGHWAYQAYANWVIRMVYEPVELIYA